MPTSPLTMLDGNWVALGAGPATIEARFTGAVDLFFGANPPAAPNTGHFTLYHHGRGRAYYDYTGTEPIHARKFDMTSGLKAAVVATGENISAGSGSPPPSPHLTYGIKEKLYAGGSITLAALATRVGGKLASVSVSLKDVTADYVYKDATGTVRTVPLANGDLWQLSNSPASPYPLDQNGEFKNIVGAGYLAIAADGTK